MHNKNSTQKAVILYSTLGIFMGLTVFAWMINLKSGFSDPNRKTESSEAVAQNKQDEPKSNIFSDLKNMMKSGTSLIGKNQTASVIDSTKKINSQTQSEIPDNFYKKPIVNLVPVE